MTGDISKTPTFFNLDFEYLNAKPKTTAIFRESPQDFIVDELLEIDFSDDGEHYYLQIKKTGENTTFIANELARFLKIKPMVVGYSGLKDRHAITTQWFSVQLPGKPLNLDWNEFKQKTGANADLLAIEKHNKKLRRGAHKNNHFIITLRNFHRSNDIDQRLEKIASQGVPNYFGEQRFGIDGNNLALSERWFSGLEKIKNKNKKSIILSSARSYLFNLVLSHRVKTQTWNQLLDGEPDVIPTGPLWGRGLTGCLDEILNLETTLLRPFAHWCEKMEHLGLDQQRRPLKLLPSVFTWKWCDHSLEISMSLKPGEYATSVLREITLLNDCSSKFHNNL